MAQYWIGVASRDHVMLGVRGGFCQLNHGKEGPLKRMHHGDWIIYYSPKERLDDLQKLQAFTAVGRLRDNNIYQTVMTETFSPFRRDADYIKEIAAVPLQDISGSLLWREVSSRLRYGHFQIPEALFLLIADKMGVIWAQIFRAE